MDIPHIKQSLTISSVLQHYNLKADKNGRICCPFHDDKTPSMMVYTKTNTVFCFSANCKVQGKAIDSIDFIFHKESCTKQQAIKKAGELAGIHPTQSPENGTAKQVTVKPSTVESPLPSDLAGLFKQLQNNLSKSPNAISYAKQRCINPGTIPTGYNVSTLKQLKHCIIFPLKNNAGNIVSLYGRSIYNSTNQKHFYLQGRSGLYPAWPQPQTTKLILTESIIDAATLLQIPAITAEYSILACYGTNGFTTEHTEAIQQLATTSLPPWGRQKPGGLLSEPVQSKRLEIIFAFDNDDAGGAATAKYTEQLKQNYPHITISKLNIPCKDVNETAQSHHPDVFTQLLSERTVLFSSSEIKPEQVKQETPTPIASDPTPLTTSQTQPDLNNNTAAANLTTHYSHLNTQNNEQIHYNTPELLITLMGGVSMQNLDRMRVTIYLRRNPHINAQQSIRQSLDIYHDEQTEKFIRRAAEKTGHPTSLISSVIAELTEAVENWRLKQIENKKTKMKTKRELTPYQKSEALKHLQHPQLMQYTMDSLQQTGIIGEAENAMILFIAMCSSLNSEPVSVICLSQSGAGKSYLLERVAKCYPDENIIENTQFTDNSFYYWKDGLKHKVILIEDMEGAQNVEYEIRELISKKYLTKTSVHKDAKGNMQTVQHRSEGPAAILGCTTKEKLYEDNANRCILIYLDSSKAQDEKIMLYQKQVRSGEVDTKEEEQNRLCLQNMQSLLQTKKIINPYATLIDLPTSVLKPRRSIGLLLNFIEAITLYHQYHESTTPPPSGEVGRGHETGQVLYTHPTHIEWGFKLLKESLFRKSDELSATVRDFLDYLKTLLTKEKKQSFYASDIRKHSKINPRTLRKHLWELADYGYIKITGGNKYRGGHEYELTELGKDNSLKPSIDRHIEALMQKIWAVYNSKGQ